MGSTFSIIANLVDIDGESIHPVTLIVAGGRILSIEKIDDPSPAQTPTPSDRPYLLPGFIDSHVHIESSMLVPSEFARLAVVHGTVATVSDPHEIANVCGMAGVEYMIENGKTVPFKFNFGAPSCVPATTFETAGAALNSEEVGQLLERKEIKYLSEMMNFPGVLNNDQEVMKKIRSARRLQKPVDGHAPGLRGELAKRYIQANTQSNGGGPDAVTISTDHECFTEAEALDKLKYGMKILIREGSAAKNFEALIGLLNDYPEKIMFCSDDKHPDSLVIGHINQLCARAVAKGINLYNVLRAACINPVLHYKLDIGLLKPGDPADFILVNDLINFEVIETYINGEMVAEKGRSNIKAGKSAIINNFSCDKKAIADFEILASNQGKQLPISVIEALDGQLITNKISMPPAIEDARMVSDPERDILKIVVVNRYNNAPVAKAFIRNFGLKKGAIASSVAHDSHNIVAIGVDDKSLCQAVNSLIEHKGGVCFSKDGSVSTVPLPVAGLMSNEDGYEVALNYSALDVEVKKAGCTLAAPFMTLSFMALLVIPHLKLSDKGLFDGDSFQFV